MTQPEFSRPVRLDTLGDVPRAMAVEADEAERAALARRFGIVAIESLHAKASLVRAGERVQCDGRLRAVVTQACVASGEPVKASLDEAFALRFVPETGDGAEDEIELDAADLDEIGYDGSSVDVGEAVAQTLALALDPFPRAPNADAALREAGVIGEEEAGPFGALKELKDRLR